MAPSPDRRRALDSGWEAAAEGGAPMPARVPGTAAELLRQAGLPVGDLDGQTWEWRLRFAAEPGDAVLWLDGLATVCSVELNGEVVARGTSMFARHAIDVAGVLREDNTLVLRFEALSPLLAVRRRPRARWRTRLAANDLRWFRTMLMGRAPGFAPGPPVVGPWRGVFIGPPPPVTAIVLRPWIEGADGIVSVRAEGADEARIGEHRVALDEGAGELRVPRAERWWPHTHGAPVLHDLELLAAGEVVHRVRVGFRSLDWPADLERDGLALHVNDTPVFARGAVWTPVAPDETRPTVERLRDAGMNLVRIVGTAHYEDAAFHDACDELGILVWQDFMFANLDYPIEDPDFRAQVEDEARQVLGDVAGRPSLAVLCGNSEIEQQVAMLGLDPALGRGPLFGEILPRLAREAGAHVPYIPSAPFGGALPFRSDSGVANYFGVGGYLRDLSDVRRAEVRFASECLALANVPGEDVVARRGPDAGVPRDAGTTWDFADVRDHYLQTLFEVDPVALRELDLERYLELSRAVGGELMAEVFGEWRRAASPCAGGIVLWLRDLEPGAGWGLLDSAGAPKAVYHHLRRVLAPVAVWTTDEGMNGIALHVANDGPLALEAELRLALYRDFERRDDEARHPVRLDPSSAISFDAEALLGRFADASWSYRFGPPAHHVLVVSLERDGEPVSQAFRFVAGRPLVRLSAVQLGLEAAIEGETLVVTSRRLAYGVRIHAEGCAPADDAFCIEPGATRRIALGAAPRDAVAVSALNLATVVRAGG